MSYYSVLGSIFCCFDVKAGFLEALADSQGKAGLIIYNEGNGFALGYSISN